jgi:hypothetical protein
MLTENQTKIIDSLKAEFLAINKARQQSPSSGLIDKSFFDKIKSDSERIEKECKAITKSTYDIILTQAQEDVSRLNVDLEPMGLKAYVKSSEYYVYAKICIPDREGYSDDEISWDYYRESASVQAPNNVHYSCYPKYNGINYGNYYGKTIYPNIEAVTKQDSFKNKLYNLYNKLSKLK